MVQDTGRIVDFSDGRFLAFIGCLLITSVGGSVSLIIYNSSAHALSNTLTICFLIALFLTVGMYLLILKIREGLEITDARFIFVVLFLLYGVCPPLLGRQKWDVSPEQINMQSAFCFWLGSLGLLSSLVFIRLSKRGFHNEHVPAANIVNGLRQAALVGF